MQESKLAPSFPRPQGSRVVEREGNKLSNKGERSQGMEVGKNGWLEWARGYLPNELHLECDPGEGLAAEGTASD